MSQDGAYTTLGMMQHVASSGFRGGIHPAVRAALAEARDGRCPHASGWDLPPWLHSGWPGGFRIEHPVPPLRQEQCAHCSAVGGAKQRGSPSPGGGAAPVILLRVCGACRSAWYCSQECQRAAWPAHKADCASRQQQRQDQRSSGSSR